MRLVWRFQKQTHFYLTLREFFKELASSKTNFQTIVSVSFCVPSCRFCEFCRFCIEFWRFCRNRWWWRNALKSTSASTININPIMKNIEIITGSCIFSYAICSQSRISRPVRAHYIFQYFLKVYKISVPTVPCQTAVIDQFKIAFFDSLGWSVSWRWIVNLRINMASRIITNPIIAIMISVKSTSSFFLLIKKWLGPSQIRLKTFSSYYTTVIEKCIFNFKWYFWKMKHFVFKKWS